MGPINDPSSAAHVTIQDCVACREEPIAAVDLHLNANLEQVDTSRIKGLTASQPTIDEAKIMPMYSAGILAKESLLENAVLVGATKQVSAQLANAKTLMNHSGVQDILQAPKITVSSALRVTPGLYHFNPGFSSNSVLADNSSLIIASELELTDTMLTIEPSVATITIIVERLTCGQGAQITYDESTVWKPVALPALTAPSGVSCNPASYGAAATQTVPMVATEPIAPWQSANTCATAGAQHRYLCPERCGHIPASSQFN